MDFKSELQFQTYVTDLATVAGWLVFCHPDSRASVSFSSPGFPDLVLTKANRLIFAELKMPGKKPTASQNKWLNILSQCAPVYVWYPRDLPLIKSILKGV